MLAICVSIIKNTKEKNCVSYRTQVLSIAIFMGFIAFAYELYMAIALSKDAKNKKHQILNIHYTIYVYVSAAGFFSLLSIFILS